VERYDQQEAEVQTLKEVRKAQGLSRRELAARAGISRNTIVNAEQQPSHQLQPLVAKALAEALEIDREEVRELAGRR
jgi:transcriptional regulator with XRE-family HTH domain